MNVAILLSVVFLALCTAQIISYETTDDPKPSCTNKEFEETAEKIKFDLIQTVGMEREWTNVRLDGLTECIENKECLKENINLIVKGIALIITDLPLDSLPLGSRYAYCTRIRMKPEEISPKHPRRRRNPQVLQVDNMMSRPPTTCYVKGCLDQCCSSYRGTPSK